MTGNDARGSKVAIDGNTRAVFFDAVGTLIHPDPAVGAVYAEIGRRHGSSQRFDDIRARFGPAFRRQEQLDSAAAWQTSEEREFQRWRDIVTEILDDVPSPAACFAELYEHFARPSAWRCTADAAVTLRNLTERGLIVGMASNFDQRLHGVVAGLPELAALRHVVVSSEVGWRKPSAHFFAAMCQTANLTPAEVLFVGDDVVNDLEGAQQAGVPALLYDPAGQHAARKPIAALADLLRPVL